MSIEARALANDASPDRVSIQQQTSPEDDALITEHGHAMLSQ